MRRFASWRRLPVCVQLLAMLLPSTAHATEAARECINAHIEGQTWRAQGQLLAARGRFVSCAKPECPAVIHAECAELEQQVEAATPTVVLAAVSAGQDVEHAVVRIDEDAREIPLDGRAISLDPGEHRFSVMLPDGRTQTLSALLRESEKYRRLSADFGAIPTADEGKPKSPPRQSSPAPTRAARVTAERSHRTPRAIYALGAIGAAALVSFSAFALSGRAKQSALERCAPQCDNGEVDVMYRRYLLADISLGVAVASLAAGAYIWFRPAPTSVRQRSNATSARVDANLTFNRGVQLSVAGEF